MVEKTNKIWTPPPNLRISDWADRYRRLSPESSAESGQWKTDRAPYQREIMDAFNDPETQRIVWMKSSQVGATEVLLNVIGYYIDQDPAPMLIMQPTLAMAQAFSKDRLATMIRDSEKIRDCVKDPRSRDSGNTVLSKKFIGGNLSMVGSNSASGLASRAIRIMLADECDRYEASAGAEGDPISLATKRTTTFWNRKIYLCSTPTIKGISRIETAFEESDKRYYYVPCPECKEMQVLKWKNIVWDENKPETAHYACGECGSVINESKKQWMLKHGEWRATAEKTNTAGFHISELYSVWSTWAEMAINFLEAKKNPEMLKTWVNTSLGESWEEQGTTLDHEKLLERRLNYDIDSIPEKVLVIVAGCDTQADRIEVTLTGYGRGYVAYVLDHKVLWGDPNAPQVWADLDELLRQRFKTESGRLIPISCTCVDSGGHSTNAVYEFTKPRQARRIFAIKGLSVAGKPIANKPSYVGKNKAVLYGVGTDTAKELIFSRLMTDLDKSTLHFPHNVDDDYFLQLTAEKRVTKFVRGRKSLVWKQIRNRNETLDCLVYCFAAIYILNPNWDLLEMKTLDKEVVVPNKDDSSPLIRRKTQRNTNFANNWKDI